jgi:hypothetical protein
MCTAIARYARQNSRPYSDIATTPSVSDGISSPARPITRLPILRRCSPSTDAQTAMTRANFEQRGELSAAVELRGLFPGIARRGKGERQLWRSDAGFDGVKQFIPLQPLLSHLFAAPRG